MRFAHLIVEYLNIDEPDAQPPARSDGLQHRLLGRKTGRVVLVFVLFRFAVFYLPRGEDLVEETNVARERFFNARYFDDVYAGAVNQMVGVNGNCTGFILFVECLLQRGFYEFIQ